MFFLIRLMQMNMRLSPTNCFSKTRDPVPGFSPARFWNWFPPSPRELPPLGPLCLFSIPHSSTSTFPQKLHGWRITSCSGSQAHAHGLWWKHLRCPLPSNQSVMRLAWQTAAAVDLPESPSPAQWSRHNQLSGLVVQCLP